MNDYKKQQLATAVKWGVGLLAAASIALVVFMAVRGLTGGGGGGGPSCEDRGGRRVLVNTIPIVSGKIAILVPVYRCEEVAP